MSVRLPPGVDWLIWRVVMSDSIHVGLQEVETYWSLEDLLDAHELLDAFQDAQRKATTSSSKV